jgi:FtsH-binding integral membrane protein
MLKNLSPAGFIAIVIILACIVWCFVYPAEIEIAASIGGTVFFVGLLLGAFDTD